MPKWESTPQTIPGLREWTAREGTFAIMPASRVVVDANHAPKLTEVANTFHEELQHLTRLPLELATTIDPKKGDLFLTIDGSEVGIGEEGYHLDIADQLTLRARTETGLFYGMQTVLQMLQQDPASRQLPAGKARDEPRFVHRALMLDAGRRYWQLDTLRRIIRRMSYFKLNMLHLHFCDWRAFRLQSDLYPGLAADEAYSKSEIAGLQAFARRCHVTLIPEIDLPSHATAITRYDPTLALDCPSMSFSHWLGGELGGWTLDYTTPRVREWAKILLGEFAPLFDGPFFHIGSDEVPEEGLVACSKLMDYARRQGYPHPGDVLVEWINHLAEFLQSLGKQTQIWNWWERSSHSIAPHPSIIINVWVGEGKVDPFLEAGYRVVGSPEDTHYISPGLLLQPQNETLYQAWTLNPHPNMLGYKICTWADFVEDQTDEFFEAHLREPCAILAERTWCGGAPSKPLAVFLELLEATSNIASRQTG